MSNSLCDVQWNNASSASGDIEVRHPLYSTIMATIVFNGFLCYATFMINIVTIHALRKASFPEKPLKALLLSLTISDLGVGLLGQPLYIVEQAEKLRCNVPDNATSIVSATVHNLLFMTSFGSIMALSVNRFVAIQMPLRYQNIVTYKRAVTAVATIWFSSAVFILCTLFVLQRNIAFAIFIIIEIVCFITTTLSSCKIYFVLKRHKNEIQSQRQQVAQNNNMLNTVGLTKSASCTFWIYLAFWLCYLPFIIIMITEMCLPNTIMEALFMCSETIVLLNSSLNPIIYCWKMRHVRHAVKSILRNIFRSFNGKDGRTVNETL